jgi:putative transposase
LTRPDCVRCVVEALGARRAGHDVGRDQVARLMRVAGIAGVRRGNGSAPPSPIRPRPGTRIW